MLPWKALTLTRRTKRSFLQLSWAIILKSKKTTKECFSTKQARLSSLVGLPRTKRWLRLSQRSQHANKVAPCHRTVTKTIPPQSPIQVSVMSWNTYILQLQSGKPMATDQLHLASPHRHRAGSWCSRWLVGGFQLVKKTNPRTPLWKGSYLPTNLTSNLHHQLTMSWLAKQNSWGVGPGFSWPQPLSNMEHKDSRPHIWMFKSLVLTRVWSADPRP